MSLICRVSFAVLLIATSLISTSRPLQAATLASAKVAAQAGRADEAIAQLNSIITATPSDAEAYSLLCKVEDSLQNFDQAISACEKAVDIAPSNSYYSLYLARAYGDRADHAGPLKGLSLAGKVRESFQRAVALDGKNIEALSDLGEFYVAAPGIIGGGTDKAQALVPKLQALSVARAHRLQAMIDAKKGDNEAAESEYKQEIEVTRSPESYVDIATFYKRRSQWEQAATAALSAIQADTQHGPDSVDAAKLLLELNRNVSVAQQALRDYLASPHKTAGTPAFRVHTMLGDSLAKQGAKDEAAKEYAAALELAHDYQPARKASGK